MFYQLYIFSSLLSFLTFSSALQCRNEKNEPVDWFTLYKLPKLKHANTLIEKGVGYVYVDSNNYKQWTLSERSINDTNSVIGNTLNPLYTSRNNISYVLYNDQPPNEPSKENKGHTKGVVLTDTVGGLWLIHSVPHFPELSLYKYPKSGTEKGQSFLCISLNLKNLNQVGIQLQYNEPQVYEKYIADILDVKLDDLVAAANGTVVTQAPWYNKLQLTSQNGAVFQSFAKSSKFGKDLYVDWVAQDLESDLYVETWQNGAGRISSTCNRKFKVYNVQSIEIDEASASFSSTDDHSKWATSVFSPWICIGDINRMEHQKLRGGGTVCSNNEMLAVNYGRSVETRQKCFTNLF